MSSLGNFYQVSRINRLILNQKNTQMKQLSQRIRAVESLLKTIKNSATVHLYIVQASYEIKRKRHNFTGTNGHINKFDHTKREEKNLIFYVLQSFNSVIKKIIRVIVHVFLTELKAMLTLKK